MLAKIISEIINPRVEDAEIRSRSSILQVERQNLETRLQRLSKADESFNQNISTIFELASKSHELFKSSDIEEKRRIISLLFPNLSMNGEKLVFIMRKPFEMFLNLTDRQEWLLGRGSNPRPIG